MQLILITHAQTEARRGSATDVWRLSPEGEAQAAQLARAAFWADVQRVVVSSEPKTRLTVAATCQERSLPIWVDSRFDELRRDGWVEEYAAAVRAALAQPDASHAGWEPATRALGRGLRGLAALQRRFPGETVAVVGHGIQFSLLRAHLIGQEHVNPDAWARLPFAAAARIDVDKLAVIADFPYGDQAFVRA